MNAELGNPTSDLTTKRTRRAVLRRALVLGGIVVPASALLAACGATTPAVPTSAPAQPTSSGASSAPAAPTSAPSGASGAPTAPAAKPSAAPTAALSPAASTAGTPAASGGQPTGTLTVATNTLGEEIWVTHRSGIIPAPVIDAVYESPIRQNVDTLAYEPGQFASWDKSADLKTWTFHLQKGMQFHGGYGELTADDFVFSMSTIYRSDSTNGNNPAYKAFCGATEQDMMKNVKVVDPYTITITSPSPQPIGEFTWANGGAVPFAILSKKYVDKVGLDAAGKQPIGTGPYMFVDHKPGESVTLKAVPNHWRKNPAFGQVVFQVVPDPSGRVVAVAGGQADVVEASVDLLPQFKARNVRILQRPQAYVSWLDMRGQWDKKWPEYDPSLPWVDGNHPDAALKVRKAINLAIDRNTLADKFYNGYAHPAGMGGSNFFPGDSWYRSSWTPYPYDPAQAKQLLADAGYASGFDVELSVFETAGKPIGNVHPVIKQFLDAVGVRVTLVPQELPQMLDMISKRTMPKRWVIYTQGRFADPSAFLDVIYRSKALRAWLEDPKLDSMLDDLDQTVDLAQRTQKLLTIGDWFYNGYYESPLTLFDYTLALSNKVADWPLIRGKAGLHNFEYVTHPA